MYFARITVIVVFISAQYSRAADVAREVEGGVQLLKTGPIQLIVPDILSFTIKNHPGCRGDFVICYVYKPTITRDRLKKYANVGSNCPPDSCTLIMTHTGGVFGLGSERHDGNFYGLLVDSGAMCPRHAVNGRSNFTIRELPNCPVIVDGAMLLKNEEIEPKTAKATVWIIPVCVGAVLLVLGIAIVVLYCCIRSKKKPVQPPRSNGQDQRILKSTKSPASHRRKASGSKRSEPNFVASASPKTPT
uniref:Secreted protein n=1 Tax=Panagrellus redivivus TaxID=6233 RepID=A0A7E4UL64_PANRE